MEITKTKKTNGGYEFFGSDPKTKAEILLGNLKALPEGGYGIFKSDAKAGKDVQVSYIGANLNIESFLPKEL
jgi:hypothetical protein